MIRDAFDSAVLIDTSAVIALHDPTEPCHREARLFYTSQTSVEWFAIDVTSHECFTRARYKHDSQATAREHYDFLRSSSEVRKIEFIADDEVEALSILDRYDDHRLSFHDALCAAVMLRHGIIRVFTFDADFWTMGFEVVPGPTRCV